MDLISVIMPTYNAAQWVSYTIDNLAAQTYPHFELIVSDDGSQDDTVAVARSLEGVQVHARPKRDQLEHVPPRARHCGCLCRHICS